MRERMKYERQWIIRVCQGARSLEQVALNVDLALHGDGSKQKSRQLVTPPACTAALGIFQVADAGAEAAEARHGYAGLKAHSPIRD